MRLKALVSPLEVQLWPTAISQSLFDPNLSCLDHKEKEEGYRFRDNNLISQHLAPSQNTGEAQAEQKVGDPVTCCCVCSCVKRAFSLLR